MDVVATGVHDGYVDPVGVERAHRARVRQPGPLLHGQRVHVRAQPDDRAVAVAQDTDDPGPAHAGRHLGAELGEPRRDDPGGAGLGERELGVGVQVLVERDEIHGNHYLSSAMRSTRARVRRGMRWEREMTVLERVTPGISRTRLVTR